MTEIAQKGQKSLFSLWSPSRENKLNYSVLLMEGSCRYKDSDNSDNSNNRDNDKDNISGNYNNSNMKVTKIININTTTNNNNITYNIASLILVNLK